MKWTITLPYTHTTINSRFVKRQTNSRVTCKDSYGKNLIRTNHVISCVREPLDETPEIRDSREKDFKLWLTGGEKSGANLLREHMNTMAREQLYFDDYESMSSLIHQFRFGTTEKDLGRKYGVICNLPGVLKV